MPANIGFAALQVIPSFHGAQAALAGGISGPATAAGKSAGGLFGGAMGTALKAAAPVALVAGVGAGLLKLGSSFHDSFKTIRVSTGETGKSLEGLEGSFKKVLATRPDSFDSVSTAIAKLNVGLGLTGAPLEALATQVLRVSSLTKTDLGTNLESVTKLFNAFGVKAGEQGPKLDELFRASQATGVSVADLASSMASSGSVLQTVGFDFEQSAALLGLLGKSGVSTTSIMAPLSKAIATAAKSGKSAGDVFKDTFDAIRSAPDATSAAGAAIAVFGARAGPKLAGLIRQGKLSYEELAATISSGTDTIGAAAKDTSTLSGKFKILKNAIAVGLQPAASALFDSLNALAAKALPHITAGIATVSHALEVIGGAFKALMGDDGPQGFGEIMDNLLGNSGKYVGLFRSLGEVILKVVGFVKDNLKPILIALGIGLATVVGPALAGIAGAFLALISPVGLVVGALILAYTRFKIVRDIVGAVIDFVTGTVAPAVASFASFVAEQFSQLVEWVRLHWAGIEETISHVMRAVREVVGVAVDWISTIWRAWGDDIMRVVGFAWDFIRETVENAINLVRSIIETVVALINGDWGKAWDGIKGILAAVWDQIWNIVSTALNLVGSLIGAVISSVQEIWRGAWDKIAGFVDAAWRRITGVLSGVGNFLHTNVVRPFEGILTFISRLPGRITSLASGMWDGIKNAFRSALNALIGMWNRFRIPSLTVGGQDPLGSFGPSLPKVTIGGWDLPNIPYLHRGGLFSVPGGGQGLAMLLDGERVLSPSQADQFPGGGTRVVQVMLDRKVIAQAVYEEFADRAGSDGPFLGQAGAA